jgi:hypothetical protein
VSAVTPGGTGGLHAMALPLPLRILVAPVVGAIVVVGVWVTGGLITDDFKASAALTAVWFAVAGAACAVLAYRVRSLRLPVAIGYLATAAAVGGFLAWSTLHDRVVHERVVVGVPVSRVVAAPPALRHARPVQLSAGAFRSGEHRTTGRAAIVRLPSGRLVLTITRFRTSPGPDLRVRVVPGRAERGDAAGNRDLGGLKGNIGDQQYKLPRGTSARATVVIWCRAFSATFGTAALVRS